MKGKGTYIASRRVKKEVWTRVISLYREITIVIQTEVTAPFMILEMEEQANWQAEDGTKW